MGRYGFDILAAQAGLGAAVVLSLNARLGTGTVVAVARRLLLSEPLLFPEFRSSVLEPNLEMIYRKCLQN